MRMRFCCLDCHEAGICCYLMKHIENLLLPFVTYFLSLPRKYSDIETSLLTLIHNHWSVGIIVESDEINAMLQHENIVAFLLL
jgi:hypothetical protein